MPAAPARQAPASLRAVVQACDHIDHAWRRVHRDPEQLGALAARTLGRLTRPLRASLPIAAWLARTVALPEQLPSGRRSTAVTVFHNGSFAVEIRHWAEQDIAPHAHAVAGWACVLRGTCLEATYRFRPTSRIGASIQIGEMSCAGVAHLSPGRSFELAADGSQIHALLPLEPVTLLICRTLTGVPASEPKYLPPALAYAAMDLGALATRWLQVARMLAKLDAARATAVAVEAIRACDPELAVHLAIEMASCCGSVEDFQPVLDAILQLRPEFAALPAVFETVFRDRALQRARRSLPPGPQRLVCALLSLPLSWRQLRALVRSLAPGPVAAFLADALAGIAAHHGRPDETSARAQRELRALLQRSERDAAGGQPWWLPIQKELRQRLGLPA